ncbi:MAG TPA: hypothetical protein PLI13_16220, partial [Paracoccus sp. (in: a-proteobacteria)]|nr:hypothetical protein [Paracoccus sp. (in: a-proteobacteria)]
EPISMYWMSEVSYSARGVAPVPEPETYALMLAGPLLQGLAGKTDPNAYIFAPVLLAGSIPLIAGRAIAPSPKLMALAILICGAVVMGLWYLGTLLVPAAAPLAISG